MKLTFPRGCISKLSLMVSSPLALKSRAWLPLLLLLGTCTSSGCNDRRPPLYPVEGTVAFATGAPVRYASIEFVPTTSGPSPRGQIDAKGRFALGTYDGIDGAPAGDYKVVVIQTVEPDTSGGFVTLGEEHAAHAASTQWVHIKHASPETSGIKLKVQPTKRNQFAIVVESL